MSVVGSGFSKLTREERFKKLLELGFLTQDDLNYLQQGGIKTLDLAEKFVENVIGYFQLPLGVAVNCRIDQCDYVIPMAVEETSIIAAMSKTAAWINQHGTLTTHLTGECIIGQIQLPLVNNFKNFANKFYQYKNNLLSQVNHDVVSSMVKRGGGVMDLELRHILRDDGHDMAIIHLLMNSCDAMGANIINQALEYLKPKIEQLTDEKVNMCILSNLNDQKLSHATIIMHDIDPILGNKLQEASLFAELDPYRAATSNKGVMNGIDPVVIATGNDWRAIESGVHAYASRNNHYQSITTWRYKDRVLTGKLTAPLIVGTVGGVTSLHPTARLCLKMMKIESANHLSRILAGVGLIQNLGAIKALCTDGITKGHMKLHINNLVLATDANNLEAPILKQYLCKWLEENQRVSLQQAQMLLENIRNNSISI